MIDTSPLGHLTAQTMESIERHAERLAADGLTVRTAMVLVELDGPRHNTMVIKCSDDRAWVMEAFVGEGLDTIRRLREETVASGPQEGDEDDET